MLGRQRLFKHKTWEAGGVVPPYVSPYLLEILSTRPGAPAFTTATGVLTANTGQTVSCARASSAYCLGDDGLLHLLGPNTVRVEPTGLLRETAATNLVYPFNPDIGTGTWQTTSGGASAPTTSTDSPDVPDPTGANHATKVHFPAVSAGQWSWLYSTGSASGINTRSVRLRVASGTATIYLIDNTSGGAVVACNLTTTWQKFTITSATTSNNWVLGYGDFDTTGFGGPAVDVYVWGCQWEDGSVATSPIITTTGTATRDGEAITVPNPLADLTQPVVNWRVGTWAQPILGASWNKVGAPASLDIFLACGTNGGSASFRLGIGAGYHTNGGGDVDTVGVQSVAPGWADQDTDDALNVLLTVSGGFASAVPAVDSQPVNVGQLDPFDATITLGSPVGFTSFAHQGHMRDIIADNT